MGESLKKALRVVFDRSLKLEFHGAKGLTSWGWSLRALRKRRISESSRVKERMLMWESQKLQSKGSTSEGGCSGFVFF